MNAIEAEIRHALQFLGPAPQDWAERLETEGYTGRRNSASRCPLAKYLRACLGSIPVSVTGGEIYAGDVVVPLGVTGRLFVARFDEGRYPSLIEE
jgi:hypothetical protein